MNVALSDNDIRKYIRNVYTYDELQHMKPNDLLARLPIVLLYLDSPDSGHWVLICKVNSGIEFFDPYGINVDQEFKYLPFQNTMPKYLANLLLELQKRYKIFWNEFRFQKMGKEIATCGRHCIVRNMFNYLPIEEYKAVVDSVCKYNKITPDELVLNIVTI